MININKTNSDIRTLNERFISGDYNKITAAKDAMGLTLREFIMKAAEILPIYDSKEVPKQVQAGFEEAQVPENGRIRLTKAAGKVIEWRIKS